MYLTDEMPKQIACQVCDENKLNDFDTVRRFGSLNWFRKFVIFERNSRLHVPLLMEADVSF